MKFDDWFIWEVFDFSFFIVRKEDIMDNFIMFPTSLITFKMPRSAMLLLGILYSNSRQLGYAYGTNKYYAQQLGFLLGLLLTY